MKRLCALAVVLALAGGMTTLSGLAKEPKKENLMQKKLRHAQKVLEGIALSDFKMIASNAEELIVISKHADWKAIRSPRYELFSSEFRRIAGTLVTKAREKNLDGAALSYMELTLTCVRCHKYIREVRMARR